MEYKSWTAVEVLHYSHYHVALKMEKGLSDRSLMNSASKNLYTSV